MSTEHQKYSTENQADAIRTYAAARSIDIVKTYADEGKSGLSIEGRSALKSLLRDVESKNADFEIILVYDVSRWGRFQDADESAYYEYICRRSGISVHYCAEQFENDGSPVSTIVKGVKRAMAGEYSRELSTKVFAGQCRLIELGFRQGGAPGYGFRRQLIDQSGAPKTQLSKGEQKSLQTDRVILVEGPPEEVFIVKEIYRLFVEERATEARIAEYLNLRNIKTDIGRSWTKGTVHQVLINEKYVGNNVWNRISFKLKKKRVRNHPDMWIRSDGAFPALVNKSLFIAAQEIIRARSINMSDSEMLALLSRLRMDVGLLSGLIIDEAEGLPSSSAYRTRFGGLLQAYRLIGYTPRRDYCYLEINRRLRALHEEVVSGIVEDLNRVGCQLSEEPKNQTLKVNKEITLSIVIARCTPTQAGGYRWCLRFDTSLQSDVTVAVRMDWNNRSVLDYYIFPRIDITTQKLRLSEDNGIALDAYRFETLAEFFSFIAPVAIWEVA